MHRNKLLMSATLLAIGTAIHVMMLGFMMAKETAPIAVALGVTGTLIFGSATTVQSVRYWRSRHPE